MQQEGVKTTTICSQIDNFRMNTGYGRYGAAYNMVGFKLL
jgi:hypothetical protein